MNYKLSTQERIELMNSHRKERDKRKCDRIKAVIAYDDGHSYSEISRWLLLDDETIRRHIEEYFSAKKLLPENGGSESHLSEADAKSLTCHLQEHTYLYVKDICAYVKKHYKKDYSISGMNTWLHANRFCYKKPHAVPAKADQAQQKDFISIYENLKKMAKKEPIYFSDSTHPQHQTHLVYGWILKGERKSIATTAKQRRLNIIGGICLDGYSVVIEQADTINGESINLFLSKLRKRHKENNKIHLVLDNASYHRSKLVKDHAESLNIQLHYLPPYSPNLNPIERLWKIMHEQVSYNKYYEKFSEFMGATQHFFKHISKKKKLLQARITDNFQIMNLPNFAS